MRVKVLSCILDSPSSPLLIQLSVGNTKYRTSWSSLENGQWNETFEFLPEFHYELFSHLQLDVYTRVLYIEQWIGRVEVRLLQMSGLELNSYFEINRNSTKTPINPSKSVGVISLLIDYTEGDAIQAINDLLHPPDADLGSDLGVQANIREIVVTDTSFPRKKTVVTDIRQIEEVLEDTVNETVSYTNWLINEDSRQAIINIKDMVFAFQQGWDYLNPLQWLTGYSVLERYYKSLELKSLLKLKPAGDINQYLRIKQIHDYAFSAYGWQGINFFRKGDGIIQAALSSGANEKAIKAYLSHLEEDEYISFNDGDRTIPAHLLLFDKIDNAIVLSIRGTMSLTDSLIDFTCEYGPFYNGFAHIGIVKSAKAMKELLINEITHQMAVRGANKLIITGHSLGAGIAAALTVLLVKDGFKFKLITYTFGAPPIFSMNIANDYNDYIRSFIYKYDLVPRLSYGTVSDLVTLCATVMINSNVLELFNKHDLTKEFKIINECRTKFDRTLPQYYHPKLYIPGILYYLDDEGLYNCDREISEELIFATPQIYKDHLPSAYEHALDNLCQLQKNK